jgi:hypothetical protein
MESMGHHLGNGAGRVFSCIYSCIDYLPLDTPLELVAPGVCCLAHGANDLLKEVKPTESQDKLPQLRNI